MILTLQEQIAIEEILTEANVFSLRSKVIESAEKIWYQIKNKKEFTPIDAYNLAYHKYIK